MGIDLPPNLAGQAAQAVVRQAEKAGKSSPNSQADRNKKNDGQDTLNANIKRQNEPGSR